MTIFLEYKMIITKTTNVKIDANDYESFRILALKKQEQIGEYLGRLISAEVRKNTAFIKGESK